MCVCVCVCVCFQGSELYSLLYYSAYAEDMEYSFGPIEEGGIFICCHHCRPNAGEAPAHGWCGYSDSVELVTGDAEVCTYVYVNGLKNQRLG